MCTRPTICDPSLLTLATWKVAHHQPLTCSSIFYIISTETDNNVLADGITHHYAKTNDDNGCQVILNEVQIVDQLICGNMNFFIHH